MVTRLWRTYIFPRLIVDIVVFYLGLMLLALISTGLPLDWKFLLGAGANYLMIVFAFIYNDIEDREDDRENVFVPLTLAQQLKHVVGISYETDGPEHAKRFSNPFSHSGKTGLWWGAIVCVILIMFTLVISYYAGGTAVLLVAISNLVVGFLYSWKRVRLKSVPGLDLLSHAYLLAVVQLVYFYAYSGANLSWLAFALVILVWFKSAAGDLENEYRDFATDQSQNITNTATYLGRELTRKVGIGANYLSMFLIVAISFYNLWLYIGY